jgi:hypothetical protein
VHVECMPVRLDEAAEGKLVSRLRGGEQNALISI